MSAVPVTLVSRYDPAWPENYRLIAAYLDGHLQGIAHSIEHLGSTSIVGMTAKPIIDLIIVAQGDLFDDVRERLLAAGYVHRGDQGIPGREVFRASEGTAPAALPVHHLYYCAPEARQLGIHRAYQAYMRAHPEWRERLSEHKWQLAEALENRRQAYIDGKDAMMREIMRYAWVEAGAPGNADGPPAEDAIRLFLAGYPTPVPEMAASLRGILRRLLPGIQETLDAPARLVAYGYGPSYRDTLCTLIPSRHGVRLGLARGAGLPDPDGLLEGAGRVHRSLLFSRAADFDRPGIEPLIVSALQAWRAESTA